MTAWRPGDSWLHYNFREDVSYVYINIPKNASSWMKENFGGYLYDWQANCFRMDVTSDITRRRALAAAKQYLVILRDPIRRWLTGFAQRFWGWHPQDPGHYSNLTPGQWFDLIPWDDHTRAQTTFVSGLDLTRVTWFDCDQNLTRNVTHWMSQRFDTIIRGLDNDEHNGYNVSGQGRGWPTTGVTQQSIIDRVQAVIQDPGLQTQLRDIYQADYQLRQTVSFYGTT